MPRIYSILMNMIGSDDMDIVKAVLERCRWIWVGDGFASSDEVVIDGPRHLALYIRVILMDLAVFKELFLELGIREFLTASDYANIIDVSGRLLPASDLVYNDALWLLGSDDTDTLFSGPSAAVLNARRTQKFVNGNISNEVAEKLGVRSLRRILLTESADSMNLSLSVAAEAFGQHEVLTTRLKHILEMYADGPGILLELVQNAQDAGASEVISLLDKTQYGTSSVLSLEWLTGKALPFIASMILYLVHKIYMQYFVLVRKANLKRLLQLEDLVWALIVSTISQTFPHLFLGKTSLCLIHMLVICQGSLPSTRD
ncbi:hypothetical protein CRYUN_Cryun18bG0067200 [Craigia yunnanensis]